MSAKRGSFRAPSTWLLVTAALALSGCPDATSPDLLGGASAGQMAGVSVDPTGNIEPPPPGGIEPIGGNESTENEFGEDCYLNAECASRLCLPTEQICTVACDDEENMCPSEEFECRLIPSFGSVCVPIAPTAGPCDPCTSDLQCISGSCDIIIDRNNTVADPNSKFCLPACTSDVDCPSEFFCLEALGLCMPNDGVCEVRADSDRDGDGVNDGEDNCPDLANADQFDGDGDGYGDACDLCAEVADDQANADGDGFGDACDLCPSVAGSNADNDEDGVGDVCDNCPNDPNPEQVDVCTPPPDGIRFLLGGTAGIAGQSSSASHVLVGGSFSTRPMILNNASYQLRAFPTR